VKRARAAVACGGALGIAAGFVAYAFLLPLAGTSYHFPGSGSYSAFATATRDAAVLFLVATTVGAVIGLALGGLLRLSPALGARLASAALGVYALALRGAWGCAGPLPAEKAAAPGLPSLLLPGAVAAVAVVLLALLSRRDTTRPAANAPSTPWLALHAVFALTSAILATQLAYYVSRAAGFASGLLEIVRSVG